MMIVDICTCAHEREEHANRPIVRAYFHCAEKKFIFKSVDLVNGTRFKDR
jgi:hypothetical protein